MGLVQETPPRAAQPSCKQLGLMSQTSRRNSFVALQGVDLTLKSSLAHNPAGRSRAYKPALFSGSDHCGWRKRRNIFVIFFLLQRQKLEKNKTRQLLARAQQA